VKNAFTLGTALLALALTSGCQMMPTRDQEKSDAPLWQFHAYQVTGAGEVFSDASRAYVVLPDGAQPEQVDTVPENTAWTQAGAVIRFVGIPSRIEITHAKGRLVASRAKPATATPLAQQGTANLAAIPAFKPNKAAQIDRKALAAALGVMAQIHTPPSLRSSLNRKH
jgi:predicted FMN-binding regulatory protein PaiB